MQNQLVQIIFFFFISTVLQAQEYVIDTDYPGGNVIVNTATVSTQYYSLDADTVNLRPDLRDTRNNWFYWNFRVSGAENRSLCFSFSTNCIASFGPAYSTNNGKSWQWLQNSPDAAPDHFCYTFGSESSAVLFSSVIPYLQLDLDKFLTKYGKHPMLSVESLTMSNKGRDIEKIMIGDPGTDPEYKVLLAARHHACEAMASYVLEGLMESLLVDEDASMKWLRENVEFFIVPFMDKDGVEDGDQGKNRKPWDHLLDYSGESIYKGTAALRKQVPVWGEDKLEVVLDLHCPGLRGKWGESIYIVGAQNPDIYTVQRQFLDILIRTGIGDLDLHPESSMIEFGTAWNKSSGGVEKLGCREWASDVLGVPLAATLEIAYANNNGQMLTPDNARSFGRDLANAISVYLQTLIK